MSRPPLEVADVIRAAALGGHVDECARCGRRAISYNSCRNRHCPKCQGNARQLSRRRSMPGSCGFPGR